MHKRKLAKYTKLELKICVFCILTATVEYGKMADCGWAPKPIKSQYTDVTKFYFQICVFSRLVFDMFHYPFYLLNNILLVVFCIVVYVATLFTLKFIYSGEKING